MSCKLECVWSAGVLAVDAQIQTTMISTPQSGGSVPHLSQDASPQPTPFFQQRFSVLVSVLYLSTLYRSLSFLVDQQ